MSDGPTAEDLAVIRNESEFDSERPKRRVQNEPVDQHRQMPQATEAEQGVIASIMLSPQTVIPICQEHGLTIEWFYIPKHAVIFNGLMEMHDRCEPVDFITLTKWLDKTGHLSESGGAAYVTELFTFVPTAANASHYIEIVREKYILRKCIIVATECATRAYDAHDDVVGLLDAFEQKVLDIRKGAVSSPIETVCNVAVVCDERFAAIGENPESAFGVRTGFPNLDLCLRGLHKKEFTIIAGRPGNGKSSLAGNIADHIAVKLKKPVLFFALEDDEVKTLDRLILSRALINMEEVAHRGQKASERRRYSQAAKEFAESKLILQHDYHDFESLKSRALRVKMKFDDLALIVIDYIGLLRSSSKRAQFNRQAEVAELSWGIKMLANNLDTPVIALSQLNRESDKRGGDGKPRLSDLRESGNLEQDAHNVILIHRPELMVEDPDEKRELAGQATLIVGKQRNGPLNEIPMIFQKQVTRFIEAIDPPGVKQSALGI